MIVVKHPDYEESDDFSVMSNFDYFTANKNGIEEITRTQTERENHRPQITFADRGRKITVNFPQFSKKSPLHRWSWIEIRDFSGTTLFRNCPQEQTFTFSFTNPTPFNELVRVRAYCQVHGEFTEYVKVPDFTVKTLIDR